MFSAYTIKKMLPRLIIAVIAVNLSWEICRALMDTANVLGKGLDNIFTNLLSASGITSLDAMDSLSFGQQGAGFGILGISMTAAIWYGGALFFLPAMVAGFLGLLFAYLILVVRQIAIVLLVIASPVAIALWVLPGGENLAKKWWGIFTKLLIMYPVIVVFLQAGQVLTPIADGSDHALPKFIAILGKFAPYFMIPFVFSLLGGAIGKFAGVMNNRSKGLVDRTRNFTDEKYNRTPRAQLKQMRKKSADEAAHRRATGIITGDHLAGTDRLRHRLTRPKTELDASGNRRVVASNGFETADIEVMRAQHAQEAVRAANARKATYSAQMDAAMTELSEKTNAMSRADTLSTLLSSATSDTSSDNEKRAAIKMLVNQKATSELMAVQDKALTNEGVRTAWMTDFGENYGSLKAVSPSLATEVNQGMTGAQLDAKRKTSWANASNEQLAGMHHSGWQAYFAANGDGAKERLSEIFSNDKLRQVLAQETISEFKPVAKTSETLPPDPPLPPGASGGSGTGTTRPSGLWTP